MLTRAPGKSYQELIFANSAVGEHLGHVLSGGARVSSRSLQAAWPQKMEVNVSRRGVV